MGKVKALLAATVLAGAVTGAQPAAAQDIAGCKDVGGGDVTQSCDGLSALKTACADSARLFAAKLAVLGNGARVLLQVHQSLECHSEWATLEVRGWTGEPAVEVSIGRANEGVHGLPYREAMVGTDGGLSLDRDGNGTVRSLMLDTHDRDVLDMRYEAVFGGLTGADRLKTGDLIDSEPPCDAFESPSLCVTPRAWP
jgi:hypothetical protein